MLGISGGNSLPAMFIFQSLQKTGDKQFEQFKKEPQIEKEVAHFRERVKEIESVDEFLDDRRLMAFALSAFAMESEIQFLGRMRKVLTEPPEDEEALVNKLRDPRFKEIATAFNFAKNGVSKLKDASFVNSIVERFHTNEFELRLGEQNPALREAAFFRRKIGDIKNTFDILGNQVLRDVVTFTFDLPKEIALQSVDKQKALIDARVDIEDFKDPEFVDKFVQRFLIKKDLEAAQSGFGVSATGGNAFLLPLFSNISGGGGGLNLLV